MSIRKLFANSHQIHPQIIRKFTPDSPANYSETYSQIHPQIIRKLIRKFTRKLFGNLFAISPPNPLIPPPPPPIKPPEITLRLISDFITHF